MSYRTDPVRSMIYCDFENVLVGFRLMRDKDLQENQIEISLYNYGEGTIAPTQPPKGKKPTVKVRVDYAELLANYDCSKDTFEKEFVDSIFFALNSELAVHGYQLKDGIMPLISSVLRAYIPKKEKIWGKGTD